MTPHRLEVVIFGASGFTGKYVMNELYRIIREKNVKWGIAGKSLDKLEDSLRNFKNITGCKTDVEIIIGNIYDKNSLVRMTSKTNILINCCGPFRNFGEQVIKACISTRTHYLDISGEVEYMERMELKYHKIALENGVYVISACGFGCVPMDLGVIYLENKFGGTLNSVETYMHSIENVKPNGPHIHYGTWHSSIVSTGDDLRPVRENLFSEPLPVVEPELKSRSLIHRCPEGLWAVPFPDVVESVIKRTQRCLYGLERKRPVQVKSYLVMESLFVVVMMILLGILVRVLAIVKLGRFLLLKFPGFFSAGWVRKEVVPSEKYLDNIHYTITFIGRGWPAGTIKNTSTKTVVTKVTGINPGYRATGIAIATSAIVLLEERDKMPNEGGVYTPGAAFARTSLVEKLSRNGMNFEVVHSD